MYDYRVISVPKVHDGDTITLLMDTGFHSRHEEDIRLNNVRAPELDESGGDLARDRLESICRSARMLTVTTMRTRTEVEKMTFARYVGELYADGVSVNQQMRDFGYV